jgi:hypothetical protein
MFIGPNDETTAMAVGWKNEEEKYRMMATAAEYARRSFCQAIVLISDTRWVTSDAFCKHFNIEPPASGQAFDVDAFQKRYLDILRQHDGQMKNLPRHVWHEAVMVAIKGPRCGTHTRMAPYDRGPGDTVHYLPTDEPPFGHREGTEYRQHMRLIPEWWQ